MTETARMDMVERVAEPTVWIAYTDEGREGCSEPLRAFRSKALAEIWLMGSEDGYSSRAKIKELPIIDAALNTQQGDGE